jgi:hypothetical protein
MEVEKCTVVRKVETMNGNERGGPEKETGRGQEMV